MEQDVNQKTFDLLNLILSCDMITSFNDKLAGTKAYRQKLKQHSKGLNEEVEKVLEANLKLMYSIDEEIYQNLSINMQGLVENLSKNIVNLNPTEFLELNQIITLYCNNKEEFKQNFEITMRQIDTR